MIKKFTFLVHLFYVFVVSIQFIQAAYQQGSFNSWLSLQYLISLSKILLYHQLFILSNSLLWRDLNMIILSSPIISFLKSQVFALNIKDISNVFTIEDFASKGLLL